MASKRIYLFLSIFLALVSSEMRAATDSYSLILVEYGKDASGQQTQSLVRYHFEHGVLTKTEDIFTAKTTVLRFDLGGNRIEDDRYVVNGWGEAVDLKLGTRAPKDKSFLPAEGYGENSGKTSPNGQCIASGDGGSIWIEAPFAKRILLGSDFWRESGPECNSMLTPTFLWLDDEHILSQHHNGEIVIVDFKGHTTPVVSIPNVEALPCGPELQRNDSGQIYYRELHKAWKIDVAHRTFEPYLWESLRNNFEIEFQRNAEYGSVLRYQGAEIGRLWCDNPRTAPGYIAVAYGPVGSNLGYPEGIKVWSAESRQWSNVMPVSLAKIIGWVRD